MNFILEELRRSGCEPDVDEIAEAVWLAQFFEPRREVAREAAGPQGPAVVKPAPSVAPPDTPGPKLKPPPEPPGTPEPSAGPPTGVVPIYATGDGGSIPLRTPGAPALPGALELARAMRPLMRKVASRSQRVLDVDATVRRVAELGLWDAVMVPERGRWLSAAVILDVSLGMAMWRDTLAEFVRLLSRQGAFRDVRVWRLDAGSEEDPVLYKSSGTTRVSPLELLDATGRRVILVVSDCSAPGWYGQELPQLLDMFGRAHPCSVVQVLPQKLWPRTGLARTTEVSMRTVHPGTPNVRLVDGSTEKRLRRLGVTASLPFPVVTLEKDYVHHWALLVSGSARAAPVAVAFVPDAIGVRQRVQKLTPEQLLARFESMASREAIQLLRLFAAVPLTLPIMRLVQRTMLPDSRQSHLAEVLLSDVLQAQPADEGADPDRVVYEFVGDLRSALLDRSRASDSALALQTVLSDRIEADLGTTIDFLSMIRNPEAAKNLSIPVSDQPFASLATEVLRRLGGKYAELATRIRDGFGTGVVRPPEDVTHLSVEDFGEHLQLMWRWPDGCARVSVVGRQDRFPTNPDDPAAAFAKVVTRGEYEGRGGQLKGVPKGVWYFTVFAVYRQHGVDLVSPGKELGCRVRFRVRATLEVNYRIEGKGASRSVVLRSLRDVDLPATVLVAQPGAVQPTHKGSGRVVGRFGPAWLRPGEDLRLAFRPNPDLGWASYRLFLADTARDVKILFVDPPVKDRQF